MQLYIKPLLITMLACTYALHSDLGAAPLAPSPAASKSKNIQPSGEVSLADLLQYAETNNTELKATRSAWEAMQARIPQAGALPDPQFQYTYYAQEVETRVGPQNQKFGIRQKFPWFGKRRLRKAVTQAEAAASREAYRNKKLFVFNAIKQTYHELWYLQQSAKDTRTHIQLVASLESIVRTRFKAGSAPHSALIQTQLELGKLDDKLQSLESMQKPLMAKLNALLNRPADLPLALPTSLPPLQTDFDDDALKRRLTENSPYLQQLARLQEKEQWNVKLANKNDWPDITLGIDYIETGEALDPNAMDSGKDPVMVMASINLPIWRNHYRSAKKEARHRVTMVENQAKTATQTLQADLELALFQLRDAERKMDLYKNTLIPKANQAYQVAQQGFETGSTTFQTLIDTERTLLEFKLAWIRAQADVGKSLGKVEMLSGQDLTVHQVTTKEEDT